MSIFTRFRNWLVRLFKSRVQNEATPKPVPKPIPDVPSPTPEPEPQPDVLAVRSVSLHTAGTYDGKLWVRTNRTRWIIDRYSVQFLREDGKKICGGTFAYEDNAIMVLVSDIGMWDIKKVRVRVRESWGAPGVAETPLIEVPK